MQLWNGQETLTGSGDSLAQAVDCLREGGILALKSQTAVQLLCRADAADAVQRLRDGQQRPRKPLALLVTSLAQARALAVFDADEQALLESPERPIVLVRKREDSSLRVAPNVAPNVPDWGLLLTVSGLHLALLQWIGLPLVCTSANRSGEPVLFDNRDVMAAGDLYDLALLHDVAIHIPQDDSLAMSTSGRPQLLRRARGYAHAIVDIGVTGPIMALGGDLKHAVALAHNGRALLGSYVGDLDTGSGAATSGRSDRPPHGIACAGARADSLRCTSGLSQPAAGTDARHGTAPVPHHQAHVYTNHLMCPLPERYLALAGWRSRLGARRHPVGSEAFLVDQHGCRRAATLWPFSLPGGDQAARHPGGWRSRCAGTPD
ncbi:MAG: Sua5/YciO/YrdC/YwlC family protein [Gammaproteobacteria bacterium]